ncbi:hypothetical protein Hypma_002193 [Hypsizygus marmoreus]|uniref:Uncharacterized protein n=1 Tax=Hypsizygus marmoreus TaxID=39966 RepID=A0A369K5V1_HYPMA|nr:hypothetical protein Hypma_002193 [Hypsizygus marmoreus]
MCSNIHLSIFLTRQSARMTGVSESYLLARAHPEPILEHGIYMGFIATHSATYLPSNAPNHSEQGQSGTNQCGTGLNQTSNCQNAYLNSAADWCIWSPPEPGPGSVIGNTERIEVAWCIKNGTGARLIPDGTISGAHFVQTPDFVQITGVGNLTFLNIPAGDTGGELDPHGQDGLGNPIGGLVFSSAFGQLQEIFEWTNFISDTQFCFRACKPGPMAPTWCQHIYDVMGCAWNMPANYDAGVFENCKGDSGEPMGIYGASTFHQGEPTTPSAHPAPSSSSCASLSTIGNGLVATGTTTSAGPSATSSGTSAGPTLASPASGGANPTATNHARSHNAATITFDLVYVILVGGALALL